MNIVAEGLQHPGLDAATFTAAKPAVVSVHQEDGLSEGVKRQLLALSDRMLGGEVVEVFGGDRYMRDYTRGPADANRMVGVEIRFAPGVHILLSPERRFPAPRTGYNPQGVIYLIDPALTDGHPLRGAARLFTAVVGGAFMDGAFLQEGEDGRYSDEFRRTFVDGLETVGKYFDKLSDEDRSQLPPHVAQFRGMSRPGLQTAMQWYLNTEVEAHT